MVFRTRWENYTEIEDSSFTDQEEKDKDGCVYSYLKVSSIGVGEEGS